MPDRNMLTTGWARAYAVVKRQGSTDELRAVYASAPMPEVNYALSKQEAALDEDFERFMIGATLIHMLACQVRFNHIDREQAHGYLEVLDELGADRARPNEDGQTALELDAYWKPECDVSDLLDATVSLARTKRAETILEAGRDRSRKAHAVRTRGARPGDDT